MHRAPLAFLLLTIAAHASTPNLSAVRPTGGQRGTEVVVSLLGSRVGDGQEVLFYQPGIKATKFEKIDDNHVKATLQIAPDARLGLYDLRLRTATGLSELRTFSVGALKEQGEVEPNNDFAKPQPIALNSLVNGVAENEDVDFYVVEAKKGDRITAEVEGVRLGIIQFDPYVAIMDAKRFELSASDDSALVWQDCLASAVAPEDGKYIIQVRESAYAGNANCLYRLHVGTFPRPTATVPMGGKLGDKVSVRWIGDAAGERTTEVLLPTTATPDFGLFAQDDKGIAPYANMFRLSTFGNTIEVEPNDDQNTATAFEAPMALNGVIGKPEDQDFYVFKSKAGQSYDVKTYARGMRSPLDPVIHVLHRNIKYLTGSDDTGPNPDGSFRFTAPADGDYAIYIHDHLRKGGPDYAYRIEVTPIAPKLTLSIANERIFFGTGNIVVAVPKGNRQAILVNATRADFGGILKLLTENLPPGVSMDVDPLAANQGTTPVLFTAAADVAPAGALVSLRGELADGKTQAPSNFAGISELSNGQNNQPFWQRTVDKLALAVTEEAPYSIEVVEPKVPLVRGGSMGLKVVAKRKEGFKAAIALTVPFVPPGVGASGGVSIPEGQNEAAIPLNANGGAELKSWRIVVDGSSTGPTGPLMVSTPLAKLTIAAPYVALTYQNAAVEQGAETDMVVKVQKAVDFAGDATVTLIGLPNKATTDVKAINKDATEVVFHIKTDKVSPAGKHGSLFCQVVVTENGEPIVHNIGSGELRIDTPLPPKANAPPPVAAAPMPTPAAAPTAAPAKQLTRLEKLRLEQAEKAKAAAAGGGK